MRKHINPNLQTRTTSQPVAETWRRVWGDGNFFHFFRKENSFMTPFLLCTYFRAHPTTLLLKILAPGHSIQTLTSSYPETNTRRQTNMHTHAHTQTSLQTQNPASKDTSMRIHLRLHYIQTNTNMYKGADSYRDVLRYRGGSLVHACAMMPDIRSFNRRQRVFYVSSGEGATRR